MKFTYSVIITTYNRAERLQRLLKSLQGINFPPDGDIIVVNNNSQDKTAEIINQFSGRMPVPLHIYNEGMQGASFARNRAAEESDKNYLIIIDDDAIPCKNWLEEYKRALEEYPIQAATGKIINLWPDKTDKRQWFPEKFPVSNAEFNISEEISKLKEPRLITCNLIIEKELVIKFPFDTRIGRGNDIGGGGDSVLALNLKKYNIDTWFIPQACVTHINEDERNCTSYWYRAARIEGASQAFIEKEYSRGRYKRILFRLSALSFFSLLFISSYFSPSKKFYYKCKIIKQMSMIKEFFRNR